MAMKKILLVFAVSAATLLPAAPHNEWSEARHEALSESGRWESAIQAFERIDKESPPASQAVLMVGSSSFAMWRSAPGDMKPFTVINRGFGGSTLPDVLQYFDRVVVPYTPRLILLYEGDNDLAQHRTPRQFLSDVKTFVKRVKKVLPDTGILILTIKPSMSRWSLWTQMQEANRLVAEYCKTQEGVEPVDVGSALLGKDGRPRSGLYMSDMLHLNQEGYRLWVDVLKPRIEKMLAAAK